MSETRTRLSLLFPILALLAYAGNSAYIAHVGAAVTIPVAAFDPRDLLSGHYLRFRLELPEDDICRYTAPDQPVYYCTASQEFTTTRDQAGCGPYLNGHCQDSSFVTGLERFYIPQEHAVALEQAVRDHQGAVILAIDGNGTAVIRELLINGKPWREHLAISQSRTAEKPGTN